MKKLILLLFIPLVSFGQDYNNDSEALKICSALQVRSFASNSAADNALDKILSAIGASKRFVIQPCNNISNAVATSYKGIRYILYDPDFMNTLNYGNNWGNLFILAHEVGHHINGHSLDLVLYAADAVESVSLAQSREQELEADEFAGFILAKLGGPINAANEVISKISNDSDDTYKTHPSRSKRLAAVSRGYNKSNTNRNYNKSKKDIATEYFYKGLEKDENGDTDGAISDYTVSISLNPSSTAAYTNRGAIYRNLGDFNKSLDDLNNAINNGAKVFAHYHRARVYMALSESRDDPRMFKAIDDLTMAISFAKDEPDSWLYENRGMCKFRAIGWNSACEDFIIAKSLGAELPEFVLNRLDDIGCN